jgi:DNA-binding transcriptional ArsR family regulator
MMASKVLPPGTVLPPLVTADQPERPICPPERRERQKSRARGLGERFGPYNRFVDREMATLPRAAALVWFALWRDTKPDGTARAAISDLARRAGANRATISRALRVLTDRGLLDRVRQGGLGRGTNVYRVK